MNFAGDCSVRSYFFAIKLIKSRGKFLLYSAAKNDTLNMYQNVTAWEAVFL